MSSPLSTPGPHHTLIPAQSPDVIAKNTDLRYTRGHWCTGCHLYSPNTLTYDRDPAIKLVKQSDIAGLGFTRLCSQVFAEPATRNQAA